MIGILLHSELAKVSHEEYAVCNSKMHQQITLKMEVFVLGRIYLELGSEWRIQLSVSFHKGWLYVRMHAKQVLMTFAAIQSCKLPVVAE